MGSGMYGAISGLVGRMQMMDNIAEQLAGVKTTAYKKDVMTFEAKLGEANSGMATKGTNQTRISKQVIDFTPGHLEFTGDPLHMAINGDGFFQVQRADGSFGYARKGTFQLNAEGQLVTSDGELVMGTGGPITLPSPDVDISPDGSIYYDNESLGQQVALYRFADTSILEKIGNQLFKAKDGSEPELHPDPQIVQKNLEASNVDSMHTMMRMMANLREFEATQRALKVYSDINGKANQLGLVQ